MSKLIGSYPVLNKKVIESIKNGKNFKGVNYANYTALIELAKANHELYIVILENYWKILDAS